MTIRYLELIVLSSLTVKTFETGPGRKPAIHGIAVQFAVAIQTSSARNMRSTQKAKNV